MLWAGILTLYFQCSIVTANWFAKPIPEKLWPQRCSSHERIINDCNWCHCDTKENKFVCSARVCNAVDMFGHFNDAIANHEVGMEGHGVWRSGGAPGGNRSCVPQTHYQRDGLLCICDDDGHWPNPVCRDLFQVLHEVELTGHDRPSALHQCDQDKLYLYGCNVCFCSSFGRIDPDLCTKNNCSANDPVIRAQHDEEPPKETAATETEVYAKCELKRKYKVGCRTCACLKNNRLLCDNCEKEEDFGIARTDTDYCEAYEAGELFSIECNICTCDQKGIMYCSTRKCLKKNKKPRVQLTSTVDLTLRTVEPPVDESGCIPGTQYRDDCNTCFCTTNALGQKALSCTVKQCQTKKNEDTFKKLQDKIKNSFLRALSSDCVENTVYEANCFTCRCDVVDGVKRESCLVESSCQRLEEVRPKTNDLSSLHGYCEPAHTYKMDCNTCKCLSDGKTVACTSRVCRGRSWREKAQSTWTGQPEPLTVDVVPVTQHISADCPRGHLYQVKCNVCICLRSGNLLCTTADCGDNK